MGLCPGFLFCSFDVRVFTALGFRGREGHAATPCSAVTDWTQPELRGCYWEWGDGKEVIIVLTWGILRNWSWSDVIGVCGHQKRQGYRTLGDSDPFSGQKEVRAPKAQNHSVFEQLTSWAFLWLPCMLLTRFSSKDENWCCKDCLRVLRWTSTCCCWELRILPWFVRSGLRLLQFWLPGQGLCYFSASALTAWWTAVAWRMLTTVTKSGWGMWLSWTTAAVTQLIEK